jgi:hypothetical protein
MKERRGFGVETIMVQMVNLSGFMGCKPAQASTVGVIPYSSHRILLASPAKQV